MRKTLLCFVFSACLLATPIGLLAQQGSADTSQTGTSANTTQSDTASKHSQMITAPGCVQKGQESGGYYLTDESGKNWELTGKDVASHVNHKVTVTGHEMQGSQTHEKKVESSEKSESAGKEYADLRVTHVKMVSDSCQ